MNGQPFYIIALIDLHSKFVQLKVTKRITSEEVVSFLQDVFNIFGYCMKITSDNGGYFEDFVRELGIAHIRSAVFNPAANGSIERMNKNFRKVLVNCEKGNIQDIQSELNTYLLNYNNTPHDTTGETPSALMFKFRPRTMLELAARLPKSYNSELKERVASKQAKRANYADNRRRPVQQCQFQVGDWVQGPRGPIRRLVSKVGDFTFRSEDGYGVNTRGLRLIHRPSQESIQIPSRVARYPDRERRPPVRFPH